MTKKLTSNAHAREKQTRRPIVRRSDDVVNAIFARMIDGESLVHICSDDGMPSRTAFFEWVGEDQSIRERYSFAMELRADKLAEDILPLADKCRIGTITTEKANGDIETKTADMVERARLQIDARKWLASKMAPKKYGDKVTQEVSGPNGGPQEHVVAIRPQLSREEWLKEHGIDK